MDPSHYFDSKVTFKSPNGTEYRWKNTYPGAKMEVSLVFLSFTEY